jgi:hypothetical protein
MLHAMLQSQKWIFYKTKWRHTKQAYETLEAFEMSKLNVHFERLSVAAALLTRETTTSGESRKALPVTCSAIQVIYQILYESLLVSDGPVSRRSACVCATGVDGRHASDAAGGNYGDTARLPPGATPFHCRIHNCCNSSQFMFSKVHTRRSWC